VSIRVALCSAAAAAAAAAAGAKTAGRAGAFSAALHGAAATQGGPFLSHGLLSQRRTSPGRIRRCATDPVRQDAIEKYRQGEPKVEEAAPAAPSVTDDGRALDASTFVGSIGALVVGIALLPYPALVLYTAWSLATSGQLLQGITVQMVDGGLKLAPTALLGVFQCLSLVVVFGVVLWSSISSIFRSAGLPAGPLGLLALSQDLAFVGAFIFVIAFGLDSLGPNDNPVRGLSLSGTSPDQIFAAAQKASKLAEKGVTEATKLSAEASKLAEKQQIEILDVTAPQRKELDIALADAQKKASERLADAQKKASESLSDAQTKLSTKLTPQQGILPGVPDKKVSDKDAPTKDVLSKDVPSKDVPSKDVPSKDVLSKGESSKTLPEKADVKDAPASSASLPASSKTNKP